MAEVRGLGPSRRMTRIVCAGVFPQGALSFAGGEEILNFFGHFPGSRFSMFWNLFQRNFLSPVEGTPVAMSVSGEKMGDFLLKKRVISCFLCIFAKCTFGCGRAQNIIV